MSSLVVAIAGATGNLGTAVFDAFLQARPPMSIVVLTRIESNSHLSVPSTPNVVVKPVNYDSVSSMASALANVTHCVSNLPSQAIDAQNRLIDACVASGVGHFIPSEFGVNFLDPIIRAIPTFGPKGDVDEYLEKLRLEGKIEYTLIRVGAFLDWGLNGWLLDPRNKKAELWDGGDAVMSLTTLPTVAKAVVKVVQGKAGGKNILQVSEINLSQKQLLKLCEDTIGAEGWQITSLDVEKRVQLATERLHNGTAALNDYTAFIKKALTRPGNAAHWDKDDNSILGIEKLTDGQMKEMIQTILS